MSIFDVFLEKIGQKLSFMPNSSQENALKMIARFVVEPSLNDRIFVLKGYAGTGKTSLVGALVKTMSEMNMRTVLMAPTGRAAKVFSLMADKTAMTIHKTIYRQRKFNVDFEGFQLMDNRQSGTLFICDEASMISTLNERSPFGTGNLLDDLIEYVYSGNQCRLMMIGDTAQLPPVGQKRSPALEIDVLRGYGLDVLSAELTEVARQQLDSGILANATMLRDMLSRGQTDSLPRIMCRDYPDVRRVDGYELLEALSSSYHRQGLDETIIVTRSNMRANKFNQGVRNQILEREEELSPGDRLLVVKNNYYWGKQFDNLPFIANGDVVIVRRVHETVERYGFRFAELEIALPDYDIETDAVVLLNTLASDGPSLTVEDQQRLFANVMADYCHIPSQRDRIKAVKDNRYFNALQIKYGYCVTCHKSQGGQWEDVYLDLGYINPEHLGIDFYRWMYTAFTRARQTLYLVNMSDDMSSD